MCFSREGCRTRLPFWKVVMTSLSCRHLQFTILSVYRLSRCARNPGSWLLLSPFLLITWACRRSVLPKVTWLIRCQAWGQVTLLFPLYIGTPLTKPFLFPAIAFRTELDPIKLTQALTCAGFTAYRCAESPWALLQHAPHTGTIFSSSMMSPQDTQSSSRQETVSCPYIPITRHSQARVAAQ